MRSSLTASRPEPLADRRRPLRGDEAVRLEERHRDPLHPEAEAGRVRDAAVHRADAEALAEVVLMVVERADRGGWRLREDGDDDLEFELLLPLASREQASAPAEERVGRGLGPSWEPQRPQEI